MTVSESAINYQKKTKFALIVSNILSEPLFTLYNFVIFILGKDLGATPFQIAAFTMLKPMATILSFYWSSGLTKKRNSLQSNLIGAAFLGRVPFLFLPWIHDAWFLIAASVCYFLFFRAGTPAWIEILKLNLPDKVREKTFSFGYALSYIESMFLSLAIGALLDTNPVVWPYLFASGALLGIAGLIVFVKLPINSHFEITPTPKESLKELLIRPWKNSWNLMRSRLDFSTFQWGFMLAGFGIMLIQPALPLFLAKGLHISYMEFGIALSLCKGLGVALSSPLWARMMAKISIFQMACLVFFFFGFFPIILTLTKLHIFLLYAAYIVYGVAQGGGHLLWNLSGASFAGKGEDSSIYSGVNVVMGALRGMVAPPLGGVLCVFMGPTLVLFLGALFCLYGGYFLLRRRFSFAI